MNIHTAILLPGNTGKFFCVDGLSTAEQFNIESLLNFGGKLEFVNCGAQKEYELIFKAWKDMSKLAYDIMVNPPSIEVVKDYTIASILNEQHFNKFKTTDIYKQWANSPEGYKYLSFGFV